MLQQTNTGVWHPPQNQAAWRPEHYTSMHLWVWPKCTRRHQMVRWEFSGLSWMSVSKLQVKISYNRVSWLGKWEELNKLKYKRTPQHYFWIFLNSIYTFSVIIHCFHVLFLVYPSVSLASSSDLQHSLGQSPSCSLLFIFLPLTPPLYSFTIHSSFMLSTSSCYRLT